MTDWTEIEQARAKAHAKHGENSIEGITADDPRWLSILVEEVGEVSHELTYDSTGSLRAELVDVLAVASAWLDALDAGASRHELAEPPVCGRSWYARPQDPDLEVCVCQRLPNHRGDHICPTCSILHVDGTLTDLEDTVDRG